MHVACASCVGVREVHVSCFVRTDAHVHALIRVHTHTHARADAHAHAQAHAQEQAHAHDANTHGRALVCASGIVLFSFFLSFWFFRFCGEPVVSNKSIKGTYLPDVLPLSNSKQAVIVLKLTKRKDVQI